MQGVRPAYMAEYERLMEQLQALFAEYLERHRNLEYLQRRLESLEAKEQREAEEDERRMRKAQVRGGMHKAGLLWCLVAWQCMGVQGWAGRHGG